MRIGVLKRPATAGQAGMRIAPVARLIGNLTLRQPIECATYWLIQLRLLGRLQGKTGQAGVPDRRNARLAISDFFFFDQQLVYCLACRDQQRVIGFVAQQAQRQVGVHHGGKDCT